MSRKLTREEFIERGKNIHGEKYEYSSVIYITNKDKVIITCPLHGNFEQIPSNHICHGKGCPKCAGNINLTTKEFVDSANKIHNYKYRYDETIYGTTHKDVYINCLIHGKFLQKPSKHLAGHGCPKCGKSDRLTLDQFISRSIEIHGSKRYKYTNVVYVNAHTKVSIICCVCGCLFEQAPYNHLNGQGCPYCSLVGPFKRKKYVFPDGRTEWIQGYESWTLDHLLSESISPNDIKIKGKERPVIRYVYSGDYKVFYPDCFVKSNNMLVETKSTWTWNKEIDKNKAKIDGSLQSGYNIEFFIWNSKRELISCNKYYI